MRRIRRIGVCGYRTHYISCVGNGLDRSAKLHQTLRAGVDFLRKRAPCGGSKFSEFRHPFVCFANISPFRGITPALLYYNRHFPYQGNHPPLRAFARPLVILRRQAKDLVLKLRFTRYEMLHFVQNDKFYFAVIFRNGQDRSLRIVGANCVRPRASA